jgi:hypothetical protein
MPRGCLEIVSYYPDRAYRFPLIFKRKTLFIVYEHIKYYECVLLAFVMVPTFYLTYSINRRIGIKVVKVSAPPQAVYRFL